MAGHRLIGTILFSIGAIAGIREYLKPKDIEAMLRGKGIRLVSDDNGGKATYHENEAKLKQMELKDYRDLKKWCSQRFKYSLDDTESLTSVEEYCKDDPKTVMGNIIRAGEGGRGFSGPNFDKGCSVVYAISGDKERLNKLIGIENQVISNTEAGKKLQEGCEKEKTKDVVSAEQLSDVKKYCYDRGVRTVQDLLNKKGLSLMNEPEEYEKRLEEELIRAPDLMNEILEGQPILVDKKDILGGGLLQNGCVEKFKKKLDDSDVFPTVYAKVESRCTKKS